MDSTEWRFEGLGNLPEEKTAERKGDIRSISRAIDILRVLAEQTRPLSLAQIAAETSLPRATVQRIIGVLISQGFVASNPLSPGYRLGAGLAQVAGAVHRDIVGLCRPFIERLSAQVSHNVDLTCLYGTSAIVIDQVINRQSLHVVTHRGSSLPLHCTASGKAHLSLMDEASMRKAVVSPLKPFTDNTITDIDLLISNILEGMEVGLFFDNEEFFSGVIGIAAPLVGLSYGNYAVSVTSMRGHKGADAQLQHIHTAVIECCRGIKQAAG